MYPRVHVVQQTSLVGVFIVLVFWPSAEILRDKESAWSSENFPRLTDWSDCYFMGRTQAYRVATSSKKWHQQGEKIQFYCVIFCPFWLFFFCLRLPLTNSSAQT